MRKDTRTTHCSPGISLLSLLLVCSPSLRAQTAWTNFEARTSHALVGDPLRQQLLLFGGENSRFTNRYLGDTWRSDFSGSWLRSTSLGSQSVPEPRSGHALSFVTHQTIPSKNVAVLFGGASTGGLKSDTWKWDGGSWGQTNPTLAPSARKDHAIAADLAHNLCVLFGGNSGFSLDDTWEYDGTTWTLANPSVKPTPRWGHSMTWNSGTRKVMLFGGNGNLQDTWEYDAVTKNWRALFSATLPPGRVYSAMAFDDTNLSAVLFGGKDASQVFDDTWIWDPVGSNGWKKMTPATVPPKRFGHAMAYDPASGTVVLVGGVDATGQSLIGTYEWTGSDWRLRRPPPSPRGHAAMAYDSQRGVAVLFGGTPAAHPTPGSQYYADTWELDGVNWARATPPVSPPGRCQTSMVYDESRQRTILFGGRGAGGGILGDHWEWDGSSWIQQVLPQTPSARGDHAMAYDSKRGVTVLFGGYDVSSPYRNDTWEYNGSTWTLKNPANRPSPRAESLMAFDEARGVTVLYGPSGFASDTWEWDGVNWTNRNSTGPLAAIGFMAYDRTRSRCVVFGSYVPTSAETWEWDGNIWSKRLPTRSPPARWKAAMTYDRQRAVTLCFGGFDSTPSEAPLGDLWLYQTEVPARFLTFDLGCPGSAGIPTLESYPWSGPWIGDTYRLRVANLPSSPVLAYSYGVSNTSWNSIPLPLDLGIIGMTGCKMLHSMDIPTIQPVGTELQLPIPSLSALLGIHGYVQAILLSPGANPLGVVISNGGDGTFGVK